MGLLIVSYSAGKNFSVKKTVRNLDKLRALAITPGMLDSTGVAQIVFSLQKHAEPAIAEQARLLHA